MLLLTLREEILSAIILLFLIFYYILNKVKDKEMLFLKMSGVALLHVIFDIITVITVNNREVVPDEVNRFLHICFYITGILFAVWFYNYIVHISVHYKYMHLLENTGYILLIVFTLLLLFLPMEYKKGDGTDYSYGPLAFAGYALFLLYCTICIIMLFFARNRLDQRVRRSLLPMLAVMYSAVVLQAIIPELLMTGGNVTLICIGLFVALDNPDKDFMKQALWDFPTGLKNRNCYDRDMAKYTEQLKVKRKPCRIGFIVADMNYLKTVNDNYGHAEGDRLIAAAASVLRDQLKTAENVYRLGGDEFTAVYFSPDDRIVEQEIENVRLACAKATGYAVELSIAIGYAAGEAEESMDAVFQEADQRMYENKIRIKQEAPHLSPSR